MLIKSIEIASVSVARSSSAFEPPFELVIPRRGRLLLYRAARDPTWKFPDTRGKLLSFLRRNEASSLLSRSPSDSPASGFCSPEKFASNAAWHFFRFFPTRKHAVSRTRFCSLCLRYANTKISLKTINLFHTPYPTFTARVFPRFMPATFKQSRAFREREFHKRAGVLDKGILCTSILFSG